jgi:hypothetical protein
VTAADVVGMEVKVVEDLLIPPVRAQNEIGLPKPRAADASGEIYYCCCVLGSVWVLGLSECARVWRCIDHSVLTPGCVVQPTQSEQLACQRQPASASLQPSGQHKMPAQM